MVLFITALTLVIYFPALIKGEAVPVTGREGP
jgi:hypothetical protein